MEKCSKDIRELAAKLHEWYLEATDELHPEHYNEKARVPFDQLTKEQQFIDCYIAQRINCEILAEFRREHRGTLKFKTLSYSTYSKSLGKEDNRYRPKEVERKLNELVQDGYEILWCFNTEAKIEIILGKEIGKLTPKERALKEIRERNRQLRERGFTRDFNNQF